MCENIIQKKGDDSSDIYIFDVLRDSDLDKKLKSLNSESEPKIKHNYYLYKGNYDNDKSWHENRDQCLEDIQNKFSYNCYLTITESDDKTYKKGILYYGNKHIYQYSYNKPNCFVIFSNTLLNKYVFSFKQENNDIIHNLIDYI